MKALFIYATLLLLSPLAFAQKAKTASPALIQCIEKNGKKNADGDYNVTKICTYKNYRSVYLGVPDYKGRMFWTSKLYLKQNNTFVMVRNAEFFNEHKKELLSLLNKKFQEGFRKDKAEASKDAETKECWDGTDELRWQDWDDIQIHFDGDNIIFDISYGLGDACYSQDNGGASLTIASLKPYLK